jgi:hypothetical protein
VTQKICLFISCSLAYLRTDIRLNAPAKLIFIWYEGTFEGTFEVQARTYYEGISRQTKYVNIEKDPFTRGVIHLNTLHFKHSARAGELRHAYLAELASATCANRLPQTLTSMSATQEYHPRHPKHWRLH